MNKHTKRDWRKYNKNLVNRGSITFWINKESCNLRSIGQENEGVLSFPLLLFRQDAYLKHPLRLRTTVYFVSILKKPLPSCLNSLIKDL